MRCGEVEVEGADRPEIEVDDSDTHVYPNYGRAHLTTEPCWCEPVVETIFDDNNRPCGRLVVHREQN